MSLCVCLCSRWPPHLQRPRSAPPPHVHLPQLQPNMQPFLFISKLLREVSPKLCQSQTPQEKKKPISLATIKEKLHFQQIFYNKFHQKPTIKRWSWFISFLRAEQLHCSQTPLKTHQWATPSFIIANTRCSLFKLKVPQATNALPSANCVFICCWEYSSNYLFYIYTPAAQPHPPLKWKYVLISIKTEILSFFFYVIPLKMSPSMKDKVFFLT